MIGCPVIPSQRLDATDVEDDSRISMSLACPQQEWLAEKNAADRPRGEEHAFRHARLALEEAFVVASSG